MQLLVLDFVGNFPGTSNSGLAQLVATATGVPLSRTYLVVRTDQSTIAHELQGLGGVEFVQITQPSKFAQIQNVQGLLQRLREQLSSGDAIVVVSYSTQVLNSALAVGFGMLETKHFGDFTNAGSHAGHPTGRTGFVSHGFLQIISPSPVSSLRWDFDWFCPLDQAINILITALAKSGNCSQQQSVPDPNLRPLLADIDPRFHGKGVRTGTQGMMTQLTMTAHARGMIGMARSSNGTKYFWVQSRHEPHQVTVSPPEPRLNNPAIVDVASPEIAVPPLSAEIVPQSKAALDPPLATASETLQYRSGRLQAVLQEAKFGPYSEGRLEMYTKVGQLVKENPGITFSHLLKDAKNAASANGKLAKSGKPQPWRKITDFVEQLLTMTDGLLDQSGIPIGRGIRARKAAVHDIAPDWTVKADAEIVLRLVDLVGDLGQDDHEHLGGVLYLNRDQVTCDRVEAILFYLVDSNRLHEETVNGRIQYRRPASSSSSHLRVVSQ